MLGFFRRLLNSAIVFGLYSSIAINSMASTGQKRIELDPKMTNHLNTVMAATHQMGMAFFKDDLWSIQQSVDDLLEKVKMAKREASSRVEEHNRRHVVGFLGSAERYLTDVKTSEGIEQKEALKEAFHQLAGLLRAFKLDSKYHIIYCGKMNSTWVQEGKSLQSPLHADVKCGQIVL